MRRALKSSEVEAIFKHTPQELKPVFRMYAATGMRRSEVITLPFSDIDWESQSLIVRASVAKGKKTREIPLDDETIMMLERLREQAASRPAGWDREHVLVNAIGNPHRNSLLERFYVACKHAGIVDAVPGGAVDLYALRGTFTTLAIDGGASPKAVQAILGHSTLDMTMRVFAKATDRAKRAAISALPYANASAEAYR